MKLKLIKDGRLTGLGTFACGLVSAALIAYTFFVAENRWIGIASFVLAIGLLGFAGLSNSAASVGIPPPFTNDPVGWRKAKKTYKESEESGRSDER